MTWSSDMYAIFTVSSAESFSASRFSAFSSGVNLLISVSWSWIWDHSSCSCTCRRVFGGCATSTFCSCASFACLSILRCAVCACWAALRFKDIPHAKMSLQTTTEGSAQVKEKTRALNVLIWQVRCVRGLEGSLTAVVASGNYIHPFSGLLGVKLETIPHILGCWL